MQETQNSNSGNIVQIIKLKTELTEDEVIRIAKEREPQFKAIPGLLQKYYARTGQPDQFAGIYIWDSMESLQTFRQSELAASIPGAYQVVGAPDIESLEVLFKLRDL